MIFKRNKTYFYEFTKNKIRYRGTCKTGNKAEALRIEAERRTLGGTGKVSPRRDLPFGSLFGEFLLWSASHVKPKTHQRYRVSGKRLAAYYGDKLQAWRESMGIESFSTQRRSECSNAGTNRDIACLRTFLNWCQRNGTIEKVPYIKLLPEDSHIIRPVSPDEELSYMQKADPELRRIATLLLETGMRPDELFNPKTQWHEEYVYVTEGKTKYARRTIPLTERARVCGLGGNPTISHQVAMRRHKALQCGFRLYDWRHTFGTRMAMAGVDLMTLRELMGHSSITITQRYCHPSSEHKMMAIAKLEAWTPIKPPNLVQ